MKEFLEDVLDNGKLAAAGIFAGVFCIIFSLARTAMFYASRRD